MNNQAGTKKRNLTIILVILIVFIGAFFRLNKLGEVPASISWDEAAVGYNSWTIANFGQDETGKYFPTYFSSFLDDKHPIHIYMTAITVKLFGLSEFSTRLSSALFGIFSIIIAYFLAKQMFKSKLAGVIAAFVFAFNPYAIHYSRFNHELNFAIFFFMLSLYLFLKAVDKNPKLLPLSIFFFGVTFITYHSPKVIVPPILGLLGLLYFRRLLQMRKQLLISVIVLFFWLIFLLLNPPLLGGARVKQTSFSKEDIAKTDIYKKTNNVFLGWVDIVWKNYKTHFTYDYLFTKGDQNPRLASHNSGQFYRLDGLFLILGLIFLLLSRSKITILILTLVVLSPLPASLVNESPHSARAMFMLPSLIFIISLGMYKLLIFFRSKNLRYFGVSLIFIIYSMFAFNIMKYYLSGEYDKKDAIDFQYGMKQVVEYAKKHPEYSRVYMTDVRSQPYIFFLYYLKVPPDQFQKTVIYNEDPKNKSYNLVYSFDKYQFGGWDEIQSMPDPKLLYIIEDSKYGGLAHKNDFLVSIKVKFPNDNVAFYMVSRD